MCTILICFRFRFRWYRCRVTRILKLFYVLIYNKKSLKIWKGQSESVYRRRTDNKWTKQKGQTIICHWGVFSTSMIIHLVSSNSSAHNTFKQNTRHTIQPWQTQVFHKIYIFNGFYYDSNCNQSTIVYLFSKMAKFIVIICWFVFFNHSVKAWAE